MKIRHISLADSLMWEKGLKVFVVFVHESCCFEVWLSGRSRKVRREYHSRLQNLPAPFVPSRDPAANDYIAKAPVTAPARRPVRPGKADNRQDKNLADIYQQSKLSRLIKTGQNAVRLLSNFSNIPPGAKSKKENSGCIGLSSVIFP